MSVSSFSHVPNLVADYIRVGITRRTHERFGPFAAGFDTHSASPWRNYAVPDNGARPQPREIAELVAGFAQRGRIPRLEYVPAAAAEVEPALTAAGFTVEGRPPIIASVPGSLPAPQSPPGIAFQFATADEDLLAAAIVQHRAYAEPEPAGPHDVDRLRACVARGGLVLLARDAATGEPAGSGLIDGETPEIGELAAVGVLEPWRRRGIAASMSLRLAIAAHESGKTLVWLEAAPREESVYLGAGFVACGSKLWISHQTLDTGRSGS
jgi:GNAT superfamily N-acetyltransferase